MTDQPLIDYTPSMEFRSVRVDNRTLEHLGHPLLYFEERQVMLDCRGEIEIDPNSNWGFRVMVLTSSHDISEGRLGAVVKKRVVVHAGAWICSGAILYNCEIMENAIVGAGAVVKNMIVAENMLVEGNPAVPVAFFRDGAWRRINGQRP